MRKNTPADLVSRLLRKVIVTESGCWEYQGERNRKGYGLISADRSRNVLAHRLAWTLRYGDPGPLFVCHRCDNPPCVNPKHLFVGTAADNNADIAVKGRARNGRLRGEAHGRARLTASDVRVIREAAGGTSQKAMAMRYGVSQSTIWRAIHEDTWRSS